MKHALPLLFLLASCGEDVLCDVSAGCDESQLTPPDVVITFGEVPVGATKPVTFKVESKSRVAVELAFSEPGEPFVIVPDRAQVVAGHPAEFTATFAPTEAGAIERRSRGATVTVHLRGVGVSP